MAPNLSSLLWFAAIVLAIPVALWLLRQSPLGRLHGLRPGGVELPMRTVASLALSPSQRLVAVEVGQGADRRWLVLGVTPAGIQTLHTMDPAVAEPASGDAAIDAPLPTAHPANAANGAMAALPAPFAALLGRLRAGGQP